MSFNSIDYNVNDDQRKHEVNCIELFDQALLQCYTMVSTGKQHLTLIDSYPIRQITLD